MAATATATAPIEFQTHPSRYKHWKLDVPAGSDCAALTMAVQPLEGLRDSYELKLNSYDLGVDIELADAIQRLRFEQPQVRCIVVTGGLDRVFCAGANIHMLGSSTHGFKVNFCKYTNETRLYLEDASEHSNKRFLCALNGTASGGGYELALACDKILLCDDRNSAVSFPELPLLGVLPGTGGLTRLVDKRKVRKDQADVFSSIAEGIKGKRAVEWGLVDRIAPLSRWKEAVAEMARELARETPANAARGVELPALKVEASEAGRHYEYVTLAFEPGSRRASLTLKLPAEPGPRDGAAALAAGARWWMLQLLRELDDALLHLRLNHPLIGLVVLRVVGDAQVALAADAVLAKNENWFVNEVRGQARRVLKRVENMAKSLYAVADSGTAFAGTFFELYLACDRQYLLNDSDQPVALCVADLSRGAYPMANGLTRLQTRFLAEPARAAKVLEHVGAPLDADSANELGLATFAPDSIDWDDELRLALEERVSFSPDGLTGMEQNLRFAGPETLETKIFGRLSAWQNWIFQRPNAVGERGALKCYGTPKAPEFDYQRT
ncbi:MAG: benzoyl-CoA-dihydrodiol lyase [Planctomycetes bacterium]|nr:benzoyl-CoA-dihydrodiol lyase [Planctomycetota bacterium]